MRNGFLGVTALLGGAAYACAQGVLVTAVEVSPAPIVTVADAAVPRVAVPPAIPTDVVPAQPFGTCASAPSISYNSCDPCDAQRLWLSADYLLWWLKAQPNPTPLVTVASPADTAAAVAFLNGTSAVPVAAGAAGRPGTQVLFGDHSVDLNAFNGMRFGGGYWFGDERRCGLEGSFFLLERRSNLFVAGSDATGSPLIARPIFDTLTGMQIAEATSIPGFVAGMTSVATSSRLFGWEVNTAYNAVRDCNLRVDLLAGFRALDLNEGMVIQDSLNQLVPGFLTFGGAAIPTGSTLTDFDSFRTANHFWGPQFGTRFDWYSGRFHANVLTKLAMGVTEQIVSINGGTAVVGPGGTVTASAPGGILALPTNINRYTRDHFTVVPEIGLNLGYQITKHLEARIGYTFLYWSSVARPGNQIDPKVNSGLIPSDPIFGTAGGGARPAFNFVGSDFWAQGINLGLVFTY
jgi:hypothetical protein